MNFMEIELYLKFHRLLHVIMTLLTVIGTNSMLRPSMQQKCYIHMTILQQLTTTITI